jgi:hypothetical protein
LYGHWQDGKEETLESAFRTNEMSTLALVNKKYKLQLYSLKLDSVQISVVEWDKWD